MKIKNKKKSTYYLSDDSMKGKSIKVTQNQNSSIT
jgi:hypothetical protein